MAYDPEQDVTFWSHRIEEFSIELAVVQYGKGPVKGIIRRYKYLKKEEKEIFVDLSRMLPEELAEIYEVIPTMMERIYDALEGQVTSP